MPADNQSIYFLHGLDSSGNGTKGKFFAENFPQINSPNFHGELATRIHQLEKLCERDNAITLIGSSFGGLMASCFTEKNRERVSRLILMAPALNFGDYTPPVPAIGVPTLLLIGKHDDVTPMDPVLGLARKAFTNLTIWISDDDHMLHNSFTHLDWEKFLDTDIDFSSLQPPPRVLKNSLARISHEHFNYKLN